MERLPLKNSFYDFQPDFGLFMSKIVPTNEISEPRYFNIKSISQINYLKTNIYAISEDFIIDGIKYLATFDFNNKQFQELLKILPVEISEDIKKSLVPRTNYVFNQIEKPCCIKITAKIGNKLWSTKYEKYLPFEVLKFEPYEITKN
jgi:hypothetical protein